MPKVSLDVQAFKALASETRLDILRSLDGKKMNLSEMVRVTGLMIQTVVLFILL